jgi:hypothetical protein
MSFTIVLYMPILFHFCDVIYSVIKKDVHNFVSLYFKIRTSDKYNVNYVLLEVEC